MIYSFHLHTFWFHLTEIANGKYIDQHGEKWQYHNGRFIHEHGAMQKNIKL